MSLGYYFLLPVLFSFLTPYFKKMGVITLRGSSILLNLVLFLQALKYATLDLPQIAEFSIAPPLGIAFIVDNYSVVFLLLFTFISLLMSFYLLWYFANQKSQNESRFYIFFNMLTAGTIGLILSCDIFNVYIFFEIVGISSYALSAFKKDKLALEAGIKYLIVGSIASLFIVFAIMIIYLQLGTVNLGQIAQRFHQMDPRIAALSALMLFIGFGTKAELFPMNFWVPDIYQGSTSQVAALFSSMVSKAYLFVFFHLFYLLKLDTRYSSFIMIVAGVTFLVAEFTALNQKDIKRLFAYSTLGQLGLLFLAFSSGSAGVISGAIFYLVSHSLGKTAIFLSLGILIDRFKETSISIMGRFKSPFLAFVLIVSFLSILGIPPFSGFVGKILILKGFAVIHEYKTVAFILFVSIIEAIYFFRLIFAVTSTKATKESLSIAPINYLVLGILVFLIVLFGVYPSILTHFSDLAARSLLHPQNYINFALGVGL
ncbi:MAG: hypothetical protein GXO12_06955 [Epsilonproteobacteria bacterium]|nr:hypothetical protein [Campylobacterota bacterium]